MPSSILSQLISSTKTVVFNERWRLTDQQSPHITCIATSPPAPLLASASEDSTLLFVDIDSGVPIGIVDFENQFHIMCALWRNSSTLILGSSNGVVYELIINPHNVLHPVSMYPLLGPLTDQIRAIAFDSTGLHAILAVGYGTRVSIYAQTLPGHEWNKVDDILEPCHAASGLVNSLFFFGKGERKLFVGYAEEGFVIWRYGASSDIRRVDPEHFSGVCRIGQACLSPDQEWVSISTLNQSVVVYALGDNGPILETAKEFPLQVTLPLNPVLPVVHTSGDLVLGGTSEGDVPIVKCGEVAAVPRLHQGEGHLIRSIAAHNNDVLVGSTGLKDQVTITCFRHGKVPVCKLLRLIECRSHVTVRPLAWLRTKPSQKPFRVSLNDVLVMSSEAQKRTGTPEATVRSRLTVLRESNEMKIAICIAALAVMIVLASDPPGGQPYTSPRAHSTATGVKISSGNREYLWMQYGAREATGFIWHRMSSWSQWLWSIVYAYSCYLIQIPIVIVRFMLVGLSMWVCETLKDNLNINLACPSLTF